MDEHIRRPSGQLTEEDAVTILGRLLRGEYQNRVAADYDVNPGRVAEIKSGKLFPGAREKAIRDDHR